MAALGSSGRRRVWRLAIGDAKLRTIDFLILAHVEDQYMLIPPKKTYTTKQMGDACEMLVAAELTLAGNPALKVPDYWPGCDVIAQPPGKEPQLISVKSRTFKRGAAFVGYQQSDVFHWLAIVLLPDDLQNERRIFLLPRSIADAQSRSNSPTAKNASERYWRIDEVPNRFSDYESNFGLLERPLPS